jgi:hypothetical protein
MCSKVMYTVVNVSIHNYVDVHYVLEGARRSILPL